MSSIHNYKELYQYYLSQQTNANDEHEELTEDLDSEDLSMEFHNAFIDKDYDIFYEILKDSADEISSEVLEACFLDACHFDNPEYAIAILKKNLIDANIKDEKSITPLIYACINGNLSLVKSLVKHQAKIDTICNGKTALMAALGNGSLEIVEYLLKKGGNAKSKELLALCFRNHNCEALELLKRHGASIDISNQKEVIELFGKMVNGFKVGKDGQDLSKSRQVLLEILNEQNQLTTNPPQIIYTHIQKAIENGFLDIVEFLFENGFDFSKVSPTDTFNIFESALKANIDESYIKKLIKFGLDCTKTHPGSFETPLHVACLRNKEEAIRILLESGAKKHESNSCGFTPFDLALRHVKDTKIIDEFMSDDLILQNFRLLIDSPYNLPREEHFMRLIDSPFFEKCPIDFFQTSALFMKAKQLIEKCKKRYPDFKKDPKTTECMLTFAEEGKLDLIASLHAEGIPLPDGDERANSLLHFACKSQNLDLVQWLIDHNCDINSKNANGETVLHYALSQDDVELELIELLMKNNFDIYATNDLGESVFTHAIKSKQNTEVLEALLELDTRQSFLSMQSKNGKTFLHYIAKKGNFQALKYLIKHHAFELDPQDAQGHTPLMILFLKNTLNNKHKKIIRELIDRGCDLSKKDILGKNILHYVYQGPSFDEDIQKLLVKKCPQALLEKDCNGRTPLHLACFWHSKIEVATLFHIVRKHCNFSEFATLFDNDQNTLLHYAAQNQDEHLLQYLIDLGCQIDQSNVLGEIPLHISIVNGCVSHALKFLEMGINPKAQLKNGTSCLDLSLMSKVDAVTFDLINRGSLLFNSNQSHSLPSTYWSEQIPHEIRDMFFERACVQFSSDPDFVSISDAIKNNPLVLVQNEIPSEKILEFLWLTQDLSLVQKVIPEMSAEQFSQGFERLKLDVPSEILREYFLFSEINPNHFAIEIVPKNLPEWTDAAVQIQDLNTIVSELNFSDPTHENHIPQTLLTYEGKTYNPKDIVAYFQTYVDRIVGEKEFTLTPPKGSTHLKQFYNQLKKAVLPCVAKLKTLGTSEVDKAQKMKILLSILPGISLCGPRWQRDALMTYTKFVLNKPVDFSLSCFQLLQEMRNLIIEDFADRRDSHNIHYPLAIIKLFGDELGLVRTEFEDNFYEKPISREQVLHKFFKAYTVDEVINLVHGEVCNTSSFRDQLIDLLYVLYKDVTPAIGEDHDEYFISLWYDGAQVKREIIVQVLEHLGIIRSVKPKSTTSSTRLQACF